MTNNKLGDLLPTTKRLLVRLPWRVPAPLRIVWATLWAGLIFLVSHIWQLFAHHQLKELSVEAVIASMFPNPIIASALIAAVFVVVGSLRASFVDVVRYLDTSPRSYAVRREIRGGMVDLLKAIQDSKRYSRVVVLAHSLGGFIAYDALNTLWNETEKAKHNLAGLEDLQAAANALPNEGNAEPTKDSLKDFQSAQFALWKEMRDHGIRWLITDFITVGTPMYFADLLYTKNRRQFDLQRKRSELPQCPPRSDTETVEGPTPDPVYGWRGQPRLVTGSPYAIVRWTNYWFPAEYGFFGDWFGGPLRSLFGFGIDDKPISGNKPGRFLPGFAHSRYFRYPDRVGKNDIAPAIQQALALRTHFTTPSDQSTSTTANCPQCAALENGG